MDDELGRYIDGRIDALRKARSARMNRLRIHIDDGRQVWTPVDVQVMPGISDDDRSALLACHLREIAAAVESPDDTEGDHQ